MGETVVCFQIRIIVMGKDAKLVFLEVKKE